VAYPGTLLDSDTPLGVEIPKIFPGRALGDVKCSRERKEGEHGALGTEQTRMTKEVVVERPLPDGQVEAWEEMILDFLGYAFPIHVVPLLRFPWRLQVDRPVYFL
jgi:hypothetical protein